MLHSGIDLHKRTVVISTVDADGRPVRGAQLPAKREAVTRYFATLDGGPTAQRAVVESTSTWYWLRDLLATQGVDLRLGHSKHVKLQACEGDQLREGEDRRRRRGHPGAAAPE